jgi:hypothetical protein
MAQEHLLTKINEAAIMWNKTKDPKYKDLWYKLIKTFSDVEKDEPHAPNATR